MTRPYVQVKSENLIETMRSHLAQTLPTLTVLPGVVGTTLNGGLSRGYGDHLSEIDLTLYLDSKAHSSWIEQDCAVLPEAKRIHDTIYDAGGVLYDVKLADISAEQKRPWGHTELWDASYAEILYDPHGLVHSLLEDKLGQWPDEEELRDCLFACWWHYHLAGNIWIHRADPQQAHLVLNIAVQLLVRALFLGNNEYVPHEKWLIHLSRSLSWRPENWDDRLAQAMSSSRTNEEALRDRQSVIAGLKEEVDRFVAESYVRRRFPGMRCGDP